VRDLRARLRRAAVTILSVTLLATRPAAAPAQTGGTAADYARADTLPGRWSDLVPNERLEASWLDEHRLLFTEALPEGRHRFRIADGRSGRIEDAFDHAALAARMSEAVGDAIDEARLPVLRIAREAGGDALVLLGEDFRAYRFDPRSGDVREIALDDDGARDLRLAPVDRRRSRDLGRRTVVTFLNGGARSVEVAWIDRSGERRVYATIRPGGRHRQSTWAGHLWEVRAVDADRPDRGRYEAGLEPGVVVVGDEVLVAAPPPAHRIHAVDHRRSPDGRFRVEIRDHDLHLRRLDGDGDDDRPWVPLTDDGTAEHPYEGPIRWSPVSMHVAARRVERAERRRIHLVEAAPADRVQPRLHSFDYVKPGDPIDRPVPVLFDVCDPIAPARVVIDPDAFPEPWSISAPIWHADGRGFLVIHNRRGHRALDLVEIDATTGAARAIVSERPDTFVDYVHKVHLHHLPGTDEAIWMSERSGWNHLYLVDLATDHPGDRIRPITSGSWVVRGIDEIDADRRTIRFRASGLDADQDPYHVHHVRVNFDGSNLVRLTEGDGTHELRFAPGGAYYVDSWSRVDQPPVHELRRASDGTLVAELLRADDADLRAAGWRPPERFVAKGRDGTTDIWGVIFKPSTFDADRRYPVIENIYAGPHGHFVPKSFATWHGSRRLAELGFVVVRIDGMGTNWRSKAFHDVAWRNLGDSGFPDRRRWIEAAARTRPWMDLERVGIHGGSAGGQSALRALLAHGDFYHAAVADCGCHDNRMDKIWWNELWMGWPVGDHYAEQSNVTHAHRLEGDLLLIVGELDRNVDPASTMQVVDALIRADRDFEMLVMPGVGHGAAGTPYGRRRLEDFFVRHLLGVEPRRSVDAAGRASSPASPDRRQVVARERRH